MRRVVCGSFLLGDDPALLEWIRECVRKEQSAGTLPTDREIPTGGEFVVAIERLGFATFFDIGRGGYWLDILWVDRSKRGEGLGAALCEAVLLDVRARGGLRLSFGTMEGNAAMFAIATRLGFVREPRVDFSRALRSSPSTEEKQDVDGPVKPGHDGKGSGA